MLKKGKIYLERMIKIPEALTERESVCMQEKELERVR